MKTLTFNNPDPATGSPGTLVTTDWFQNVNDEIILVITEAGITPVSTDHTQLNQALQKVYAPLNSPNLTGTPTTTTPPDGDDSQKICNTAWVNSVITAGKLGYTPVRQGGVSDQGSDTVYIGNATDGSGLKATVNTDDLGNFAFESWVKGNYLNLTGGNITGTLTLKGTSIATVNTVNDAETDIKNWTEENYLQLTDTTTQTVTGPVAFTGNMSNSGAAGTNRQIVFETSGLARFAVGIDGDAESGANEGSNLYISRFDDEGSFIDDPLGINRETGTVEVNSSITVPAAHLRKTPSPSASYKQRSSLPMH
ncbi:hypothetical protein [Komagataeibacter nataicola]|uniref:hypothetical protein n=1 Tax=Komagataeibacter nataicola TaxID=265960 RepID=UPI00125DD838|nr:hypothetical protein [Komagataeibacter nataicola]